MNIAVIGLGHVGLAYALLFASKYKVVAYDIDSVKINNLKKDILPSKLVKHLKQILGRRSGLQMKIIEGV